MIRCLKSDCACGDCYLERGPRDLFKRITLTTATNAAELYEVFKKIKAKVDVGPVKGAWFKFIDAIQFIRSGFTWDEVVGWVRAAELIGSELRWNGSLDKYRLLQQTSLSNKTVLEALDIVFAIEHTLGVRHGNTARMDAAAISALRRSFDPPGGHDGDGVASAEGEPPRSKRCRDE